MEKLKTIVDNAVGELEDTLSGDQINKIAKVINDAKRTFPAKDERQSQFRQAAQPDDVASERSSRKRAVSEARFSGVTEEC